jgi:hypothetical protein
MSSKTIAALYNTRADAGRAVDALMSIGFPAESISMLVAEDAHGQHFRVQESNKAAEGAVGGGVAGGALGAIAAGLVAIGVIGLPGVGLVAVGPLVAVLAGAGAGAAVGGLVGALVGLGIPEHQAKVMADQAKRGGILIAVDASDRDRAHAAEEIFAATHAASMSRVA